VLSLAFPLGAESYALPLEQVREIVPAPELTPLPTAPPFVIGLLNLRGDVLPVLDAALLLGSPFPADPRYVMVVSVPAGAVGLAADGLPRIVRLEPAADGQQDVRTVAGEPVVVVDAGALVKRAHAEA
jgi:chemotaxis signal transduction protein